MELSKVYRPSSSSVSLSVDIQLLSSLDQDTCQRQEQYACQFLSVPIILAISPIPDSGKLSIIRGHGTCFSAFKTPVVYGMDTDLAA